MSAIYCNQYFPGPAEDLTGWCSFLVEMVKDTSPFQKRMGTVFLEMQVKRAGGVGERKEGASIQSYQLF